MQLNCCPSTHQTYFYNTTSLPYCKHFASVVKLHLEYLFRLRRL